MVARCMVATTRTCTPTRTNTPKTECLIREGKNFVKQNAAREALTRRESNPQHLGFIGYNTIYCATSAALRVKVEVPTKMRGCDSQL